MRLGGKESNREFCKGGARVQELQTEGRSKTLMGTGENWERACHAFSPPLPRSFDSCKRMTGEMSHAGAITVGIVYFLAIIDPKITLKDSMARILNGGSRNFQSWGLAGGSGSLEVCFWRWSWAWFFYFHHEVFELRAPTTMMVCLPTNQKLWFEISEHLSKKKCRPFIVHSWVFWSQLRKSKKYMRLKKAALDGHWRSMLKWREPKDKPSDNYSEICNSILGQWSDTPVNELCVRNPWDPWQEQK